MTHLTLYQLTDDLIELLDQVDPETGELPAELGAVRELVAAKAANVAAYIASRECQIDAMRARLKAAGDHIKAAEKRCERLRDYLLDNMARAGITEIAGDPLLRIRRYPERDTVVDVFDERQLPAAFVVQPEPPAPRPDKTAIKRAIAAGQDVPGARLLKHDRLEIK